MDISQLKTRDPLALIADAEAYTVGKLRKKSIPTAVKILCSTALVDNLQAAEMRSRLVANGYAVRVFICGFGFILRGSPSRRLQRHRNCDDRCTRLNTGAFVSCLSIIHQISARVTRRIRSRQLRTSER